MKHLKYGTMRILIYSEGAQGKPDEGVRKYCQGLVESLKKAGEDVLLLSGPETRGKQKIWNRLETNLHLLSPSLGYKIRRFHPDMVLYIPTSSLTLSSFLRGIFLAKWGKDANFGWMSLQKVSSFSHTAFLPLARLLNSEKQHLLFTSTETLIPEGWKGNGIRVVHGGVDLNKFFPATPEEKLNLRRKYGYDPNSIILLHVGHLHKTRNLELLKSIQKSGEDQVLLVGSSSTERDRKLMKELRSFGIKMFTDFIEKIEEIYRLSDCYLFPVESSAASIEIPLSVLEAMATNLPVVSTKFGGLPRIFKEGEGFFYAENCDEFLVKIVNIKKITRIKTREMALPYSWDNVAKGILEAIQ
jgi:glycosyltransferase involved in cell wall biosynthesis